MSAIIKLISAVWNDKKRIVGVLLAVFTIVLVFFGPDASSVTSPTPSKKNSAGKVVPRKSSNGGITFNKKSVPVFWQTTRSRFLSSGASTQTESYREVWQIEPRDEKSAYLVSPRAKAVIYGMDASSDSKLTPSAVVISERDLARLIGITPPSSDSDDSVDGQNLFRLVLSSSPKGGEVMTLKTSDDEQYTVQFEMGQQGAH